MTPFSDKIIKSKFLLFSFLFLLVQTFALAQTGSLKGTVIEKGTNDPLAGANVVIKGTTLGASTDFDGNFIIRNIPAGNHTITVSYLGYVQKSQAVSVVANRALELEFTLEAQVLEGETVTVTAQAQGQLEAINQQLTSDKIANVVSESRIQELPDFNAASALARLPGVSTTQSSGEDNKVVIRGLSPKYNSIEIEGVRLAATGSSNIGLTSNTDVTTAGVSNDRSVDLTMISPYMIRMISVYKSLTPDMNANSIGGTVNMELRQAPSGLHTDLLWQSGYTAKSNTYGNYRAVVSASDRFFDDNLGVYALINAESYDRNSDNLDASYDIKAGTTAVDSVTGYRPVEVNTVTLNRHLETRKRYGGNLILDYTIPNGSIKFVNLLARINSEYTDHRQIVNWDQGRMNWRMQIGENITDQQMHSLKLDYDLGFITADISASYSASTNKLENSPVVDFFQSEFDASVDFQAGAFRDNIKPEQLTNLLPNVTFVNPVLGSANLFSNDYSEKKFTYKADFEIPFAFSTGLTGFFKFGGQLYNQENSTDQETPYVGFGGGSDITNAIKDQLEENFGLLRNDEGYFNGSWFINSNKDLFDSFLDNKYGNVYYASNPNLLVDIINYIKSRPDLNASLRPGDPGNLGGWYDGPYQQLVNDYNYKENYYAGYGMAKVNFLDFMLIGGIRYEKVETEYFAYNAKDARNARQQIMYDTTSFKNNNFLLPMAQMKYSPLSWLDFRYAYTQTLARPDYHLISPKFTVIDLSSQVQAGNPNLKPAQAFNHDVSFTVHNNEIGLFSIGGFYKTIKNFVYNANYRIDAAENAGIDNINNYIIVREEVKVVEAQSNYKVYRPLNNPYDATVKGLEFDFQHNFWYLPQPFNNLVFGINYARIWSETTYPWFDVKLVSRPRPQLPLAVLIDSTTTGRLIDQPNHVLNTYLGYDYEGFSARVSFLFQDNTYTANQGKDIELDSYSTEYFRIDFSARQKLPWFNSEFFLDVKNMNNANTKSIQRSFEGFRNIQNYGLLVNLGVRVRY